MRRVMAVAAGKTARFLSRRAGNRGSSLPGNLALRLDPGLARHLASQVRGDVVVVTGTNGKTTTSNMISHILRHSLRSVVSNAEGANMMGGVATALLAGSSLRGRLSADHAVLESDEGHFPAILEATDARLAVVTNFFRDQLDRYGELDLTVRVVAGAMEKARPYMVLNADDPLTFSLSGCGPSFITYGIETSRVKRPPSYARESRFCPTCDRALVYDLYHYGQLGHYRCRECGFTRPRPDVRAEDVVQETDGIRCRVVTSRGEVRLTLPLRGLYDLHNALAATAASVRLGIDPESVMAALSTYRPATGRLERFEHGGRSVYLNLVKNPTGFNEALGLLHSHRGSMDVLLALNDNIADGRDVSWIYDADLELLRDIQDRIGRVVCTGQRPEDMAVRVRYAGLDMDKVAVVDDYGQALARVLSGESEAVYVLATYTALWPLEKLIRDRLGESAC